MAIYFYSVRDPYGCFSNFSPHGFELKGAHWNTSEHYFQAQKFAGTEWEEAIRKAGSPKEAANLGRRKDLPLRPDWERVKVGIMKEPVLAKFKAHAPIRDILLATGTEDIIENAPHDSYWGCGQDGNGKNMLGKILVEVREMLRTPQTEV